MLADESSSSHPLKRCVGFLKFSETLLALYICSKVKGLAPTSETETREMENKEKEERKRIWRHMGLLQSKYIAWFLCVCAQVHLCDRSLLSLVAGAKFEKSLGHLFLGVGCIDEVKINNNVDVSRHARTSIFEFKSIGLVFYEI